MSNQFVGEILLIPYNFAPLGWALCQGQLLPISQNTALFSLIGTYYGGNGTSTFGLPNLQGSVAVGQGQGPGLSNYYIGQTAGETSVTLLSSQLPLHNHTIPASAASGRLTTPSSATALGATGRGGAPAYGDPANFTSSAVSMAATSIAPLGGSGAHNNLMPYQVLNYIIALQGIFPARS